MLLATRYEPVVSGATAFLIDLDGTMYNPDGLLPSANLFHRWLRLARIPHVFLSNTGGKTSHDVRQKLATGPFRLAGDVPLNTILTAAEAQVDFMLDHLPRYAHLLVVSGPGSTFLSELRSRRGAEGADLVDTWDIRTVLTYDEAIQWARILIEEPQNPAKIWVCFFTDGPVGAPSHSEDSFKDWGFEMIKIIAVLLAKGANFCYTAEDAYNPSSNNSMPGTNFPIPGPGMFAALMQKIMVPQRKHNFYCVGKGGNLGHKYMFETAIGMLRAQGHVGDVSTIIMVGDRYDTDIRGGLSAGVKTCLVRSGCHGLIDQRLYRSDPCHFWAESVGELIHMDGHRSIARQSYSDFLV